MHLPHFLFPDDELSASGWRLLLRLIVGGSIEHQDRIGVLLDITRIAQIGHYRPLVIPPLDRAAQLRQQNDRNTQFLRQHLEPHCDLACLLHLVAGVPARWLDQPEVIDNQRIQPLPPLHLPRARADLCHRQSRLLLDPQRQFSHLDRRVPDAHEILLAKLPRGDLPI